ncbi:MAG TPA: hypothetical protein VK436_11460 [Methanocella sp.]|nr:hypothetical protein [Methanocella sp.]
MYRTSRIYSNLHTVIPVNRMADEDQNIDWELKTLNAVYDELSKDARTIATDLHESVEAYQMLGLYLLGFSFGMDLYIIETHGIAASDYGTILIWLIFVNLIPIAAGLFVFRRSFWLNVKYRTLFSLEQDIRLKEFRKNRARK